MLAPLETSIVTWDLHSTSLPAAGSVEITRPAATAPRGLVLAPRQQLLLLDPLRGRRLGLAGDVGHVDGQAQARR